MTKVMIVDDDEMIRSSLSASLAKSGYDTCVAKDGVEALRRYASEEPDIVVLDIMMPALNGYETCIRLRQMQADVPVIFLSAKGDIVDKTIGFSTGADDYLSKPFDTAELVLRIEAVLRRTNRSAQESSPDSITIGNLRLYPKQYELTIDGTSVDLTAREFELLVLMAESRGRVFSRGQLSESVLGADSRANENMIPVYVRRIRAKIEKDPRNPTHLVTVWGVGYKLM